MIKPVMHVLEWKIIYICICIYKKNVNEQREMRLKLRFEYIAQNE